MEQTKKRHNPPIYEEDSAAKAFDAPAQPRSDYPLTIDQAVEKASKEEMKFERGQNALRQEFLKLIEKVYGECKIEQNVIWDSDFFKREKYFHNIYLYKKSFLFSKPEKHPVISIIVNEPDPVYFDGRYRPIEIHVLGSKYWRQSQTFAKAYEYISGQKATLVKEFHEEMKDEKLEEIVNEEKIMKEKEDEKLFEELNIQKSEGAKFDLWIRDLEKMLRNKFEEDYKIRHEVTSGYYSRALGRGDGNGAWVGYKSFKIKKKIPFLPFYKTVGRVNRIMNGSCTDKIENFLCFRIFSPEIRTQAAKFAKEYREKTGKECRIVEEY